MFIPTKKIIMWTYNIMSSAYELITADPGFVSPNFDVVTCNDVIVLPSANNRCFSYYGTNGSVISGGTSQTLLTTPIVASPNFNLATNAYTADRDMYMLVTTQASCALATFGGSIFAFNLVVIINGAPLPIGCVSYFVTAPIAQINTLTNSILVRLNAGDVLQYRLTNISSGTIAVQSIQSSGYAF